MSSRRRTETGDAPLPAVVLLVGEQDTLRDAAAAELAQRTLGDAPREFNEDRFDFASAGVDATRVLDAARTLPVLAERRLVRVRGLADRRAARFLERALPDYLEAPVPTTCLLLEAPKVDRRLRWVKRVAQLGGLRDCSGPRRPQEVRAWIDDRIRAAGRKPARGVAAALLELVGGDLDRLAREIEKACLYAGERREITADDVHEVTGEVRPRAVYLLTDAIGRRDLAEALELSAELLAQGEAPLALLGALANHFRRLVRARECQPLTAREVARQLSLHPYAAERLVEQARRFDPARLQRSLAALREADEGLKGGAALSPQLAFERLVLAVGGYGGDSSIALERAGGGQGPRRFD